MEEFTMDGPVGALERMAIGQYLLDHAYDEMFAADGGAAPAL